ncbi:MAG: tRNA-intron lyase [Candidatus Lokiarchaeota archaeon]|nr:tRNA-intron lyase [Candidatus Lokiarchaeota archaeon]
MSDKSPEKPEKLQFEGVIKDDKVIISNREAIEEFYKNSYIGNIQKEGQPDEILVLEPMETLLLIERCRILLWKNNDKNGDLFNFETILEHFTRYVERLWQKYIIYMDLRKRGYVVRTGYGEGIDFRVYKRGANVENDSAKFLIYPVFEGDPIELRDLDKISRVAMSSRKDLIVATVDRLSKPIYYSVKKFQIMNKLEKLES